MEHTKVSLEKAFQIQKRECPFNMLELRGAIKTFFNELGFKEKEIFLPKNKTAGSWLDELANCIEGKIKNDEVLFQIASHN